MSRATIRYYDQTNKNWVDLELDQRLEVAGMWGNVSLLNGEPIVHVHIVLADEQGRCYGGHLGDDTLVFNLEILLTTLPGPTWSARWTPRPGSPSGTRSCCLRVRRRPTTQPHWPEIEWRRRAVVQSTIWVVLIRAGSSRPFLRLYDLHGVALIDMPERLQPVSLTMLFFPPASPSICPR